MPDLHAKGEVQLVDCRSFSFYFQLIQAIWEGKNSQPLHRICTLVRKMGAQCFLQEELDISDRLAVEAKAIRTRTKGRAEFVAQRLTFFRSIPDSRNWTDCIKDDILAYVIVARVKIPELKNFARSYIFESVVRTPTIWLTCDEHPPRPVRTSNSYIHCCREFTTTVGLADDPNPFTLTGTFFSQQNELTSACAHAALCSAINSAPQFRGTPLTSEKINAALGITHEPESRHFGELLDDPPNAHRLMGLDTDHITKIAESVGFSVQVADFELNPAVDYAEYIYPFIESGYPTILGVTQPGFSHVLAMHGHTVDSDRWIPYPTIGYRGRVSSPYLSSTTWVDHFIGSDDLFGMYVTIPTDSIRNFTVPHYNRELHAALAIGLVPKSVNIGCIAARECVNLILRKLISRIEVEPVNQWFRLLQDHVAKGQFLVLRTLLVEREKYLEVISSASDSKQNNLKPAELGALEEILRAEQYWVTEVTVPNLLTGNKRKLGDFLIAASLQHGGKQEEAYDLTDPANRFKTASKLMRDAVDFAWLPGMMWSSAIQSEKAKEWSFRGHIDILRGSGESTPDLEW